MAAVYEHAPRAQQSSEAARRVYEELPEHLRHSDGTPDYLRMMLSTHLYDLARPPPLQPASRLALIHL